MARTYGDAAALTWLEALKANAGSHLYPDNETVADEVNRGQVALGIINQYYWYRVRAEVGASNMHSKSPTSPRTTSATCSTSPAPAILKSSTHQAAAQKFVAFLNSAQGQEIIAHSDSFEYPIASGVTTAPARPRSASSNPTPSPSPSWAPGPRRSSCCKRRSCCDRRR